jgi:hypothetical protein
MTMRANIDRGLRDQAYLCCQPGHKHEIQRPRQQQQGKESATMAAWAPPLFSVLIATSIAHARPFKKNYTCKTTNAWIKHNMP